ncbi:MAG: hypothetical protein ACRDRD_17160 [Pseudonocardiaceae bacterium]
MADVADIAYAEITCAAEQCSFRYFVPFQPLFRSGRRAASPRFEDVPVHISIPRGVIPRFMLGRLFAHRCGR